MILLLERSIIAKNKFANGLSPYVETLKEMKRELSQLPITMFLKKVPAVQSAEPVPNPSMYSALSEVAADISSTSLIHDHLD